MLSWLSSIGESIGLLIQFVSSMITGMLSVFGLIGQSFAFLTVSWGFLPSVIQVFIPAGLAITIVFLLIGR